MRQDEIVKAQLVEVCSESGLGILPQSHQFGVPIKIAVGLPWRPRRVFFFLLLCEIRVLHDILSKDAKGFGGLNLACLQFRVEKRSCCPEEPVVERDQLTIERHVREHDRF